MIQETREQHAWRPFAAFVLLAFLLLGLVPVLALLSGASMDFGAVGKRAAAETGIAWTSNLLVVLRLCLVEPSLWLLVLGSAVPSLAALLVCWWIGPTALRQLLGRLRPLGSGTRPTAMLGAYGLPFVAIPLCLVATYALRSWLPGPVYFQSDDLRLSGLLLALLIAAFLDQGGVLEELGWRGFAQHHVQSRVMSPLTAALLVGAIWGLWHVPRDVVAGVTGRLGLLQYTILYLPAFVAGTVITSIIAAYAMNRAGGSVIPAIVVHGLTNDAVGLSGLADMTVALTPYHQATKALPLGILACCIIVATGWRLGAAPKCDAHRLGQETP